MNLNIYKNYKESVLDQIEIIVDIGVSDGAFIHQSAKYFNSNVRRIGIDPIIYDDFPRWEAIDYHEFAVGSTCGVVDFYESANKVESSKFEIKGKRRRVQQRRMECYLTEQQIPISAKIFVKIDTQGADIECLESFGKYLPFIKGLQIEAWMKPYGGTGKYFADTIRAIDELGFYVAEFLDPLNRAKDSRLGQIDLFCLNKIDSTYFDLDWIK